MSLKRCKKISNLNSKEIQYKLASKLNKLCDFLHKNFLINYGGCCYVAYCVAKLLEENGFEFSLIVFDQRYNLKTYYDLAELPESMDHYAITLKQDEYNYEAINCDEDDFDFSYQLFNTTSDAILQHYNEKEWNKDYKTYFNKIVQDIIEEAYYEFIENLCEKQ